MCNFGSCMCFVSKYYSGNKNDVVNYKNYCRENSIMLWKFGIIYFKIWWIGCENLNVEWKNLNYRCMMLWDSILVCCYLYV